MALPEILAEGLARTSINTALKTIPEYLLEGIERIVVVSTTEIHTAAIAANVEGAKWVPPVHMHRGTEILIDGKELLRVAASNRAKLVREAVGSFQWDKNPGLRKSFSSLWRKDKMVNVLSQYNQKDAFTRAFARLNGGLNRQISLARYFGDADRLIRDGLNMKKLTEEERAFFRLMRTSRGLGVDLTRMERANVQTYTNSLNRLYTQNTNKYLPAGQGAKLTDKKIVREVTEHAKASMTSAARTYNSHLARQIERMATEMRKRGVPVTEENLVKSLKRWSEKEQFRQVRIAQRYENAWVGSKATEDWRERNGIEKGLYYIEPSEFAQCELCKDLIAHSPYDTAPDMPPLHKNCIHRVEFRVRPEEVPATPWMGE